VERTLQPCQSNHLFSLIACRRITEAPHIGVHTVPNPRGEKYLQTYADGKPTNNLLNLPTGAALGGPR
jgi:hypothetical protein